MANTENNSERGMLSTAVGKDDQFIPAWLDVEIDAEGRATRVALVRPPLSSEMAAPIEQVVRSWTYAPGFAQGANVPRTTSVLIAVVFSNGKIIAEKNNEGPRILTRVQSDCIHIVDKTRGGGSIELEFTVNEMGRVTNLSVKNSVATKGQTDCAVKTIEATLFKPETVNGRPIASRMSQYFNAK